MGLLASKAQSVAGTCATQEEFSLNPRLEILPPSQKILWPLLSAIPHEFLLYGGTAIALQLGHRQSVGFDFFSASLLHKNALLAALPFLGDARIVQPEINTLDCYVNTAEGPVKIQFLAGLGTRQGRVEEPLRCVGNGLRVASLRDLLAAKLNTIQARAEVKDYVDITAILKTGLSLEEGLGCSQAVFGKGFDPGTSLRALCSYRDGNLAETPKEVRAYLTQLAVRVNDIPIIQPLAPTL